MIIDGKKGSKHRVNNYILTIYRDSKEVASFNFKRPTTVNRSYHSNHVGEMDYFVDKAFRGK